MITKDEERKALEKIRKIVDGLGEDSYVATAFEGCFGIAEDNIENDMACSMKQRYEIADQEAWVAQKMHHEAEEKIDELKTELIEKDQTIERLQSRVKDAMRLQADMEANILSLRERLGKSCETREEQELEICRLKARLYDLLCEQ